MATLGLDRLRAEIGGCGALRRLGRIREIGRGVLKVSVCGPDWRLGDRVRLVEGAAVGGEVVALDTDSATVLTDGPVDGARIGDGVELLGAGGIAPDDSWIGRVLDPFGQPIDGRPLMRGAEERALRAAPPAPSRRRRLGARLETGAAVFNTLLPLVRGQRIGLFAGSGVGKSSLLAKFARGVAADVIVIALIGERGRELRDFVEGVLGPDGMARSVVVAATSDQSPLIRRRCAWAAMTVAEHFRDRGLQVLLLADSITRLAEAHREVALASGEPPSLRGFPPSTSHLIMSLAERAGPGLEGAGDITAVFSVLVAGSDMDEPVADILRGVLDGHVVMEREIAERGRYPAINLLRSVSRSLPQAASEAENALIARARRLLGAYDRAEMMIQAGLYVSGSDPLIDAAVRVWPTLDAFLSEDEPESIAASFARLRQILDRAGAA
ncbi:FliI/YscN family ATPase [Defluviimonas salinarum]|uniref:FliI/YscN family ATPase n=1 Tax=Defluviimonas salinarum TaxID=2992147 RepID=A0ABT3J2W5_9RHOB|nr:FliI/YscN family ATPase [Defluviimonas salinarum]MCW3782024.1 FliI/YscN family ATPase [Defluviimonas salinarum]